MGEKGDPMEKKKIGEEPENMAAGWEGRQTENKMEKQRGKEIKGERKER